jgi:hypothetical protein
MLEVFLIQDLKATRKPYHTPSFQVLDPVAARAKLVAQKTPQDSNGRKMLAEIEIHMEKQPPEALSVALSLLPQ